MRQCRGETRRPLLTCDDSREIKAFAAQGKAGMPDDEKKKKNEKNKTGHTLADHLYGRDIGTATMPTMTTISTIKGRLRTIRSGARTMSR
jgi:hypothetical protein